MSDKTISLPFLTYVQQTYSSSWLSPVNFASIFFTEVSLKSFTSDDTILEFGTGENSEPNYLKAFFGNEHGEITVNSTKHNWNYERFGKLIHGFTNIPPCEESGQWNKYNLLNNNCHDFVKYCLTIIGAGIEKECLNIVLNPLRILYTLKMLLN